MIRSAFSRRELLGGLAGSAAMGLLLPGPLAAQSRPANAVSLPELRAAGARDDNDALARALATGRPVYLPAGRGSGPGGAYLIGTQGPRDNIGAGAHIFGDGIGRTVIVKPQRGSGYVFYADSGSPDPARNLTGIRLADLTIEDDVVRRGFAEHEHLVHLNGVTGFRAERVEFRGFRGDAIYFGSGVRQRMERHNRDLAVTGCRFDGVNTNNRNAISVIDGDGVTISGCEFLNCTRSGGPGAANSMNPRTGVSMPGAIDCEPDANAFAIVRNVRIERCRFSGGGGAAVALLLQHNGRITTPHANFTIVDCVVERQRIGFTFFGYSGRDAITGRAPYGVVYRGNQVSNCETPFIVNGAKGLRMERNVFTDCAKAAELGYTDYNHDVTLAANRFVRIGHARGGVNGLLIRNADLVTLDGNAFIDCGQADGSGGRAINFIAGRITRFRLVNNRFESPTGRTTYAIAVQGADLDRSSAVASGNVFTFRTNRDFG